MSGDALDALLAWGSAGGIYFDPLEIRVDHTGNRSAFACRRIACGEPIVSVPRRMLITDVDMAATPMGTELRRVAGMFHSRRLPMAVWLARERDHPGSPWKPYLDALPTSYAWMPSERSPADLAALTATRALHLISREASDLADDHQLLGELASELAAPSLAELTWGKQVANSRSFRIDDEDGSVRGLAPIADLFDHGRPNASFAYVAASRCLEIRADRAIPTGEEIHISYGAHSNARLIAGYGFAAEDNRDDEVELHAGPPVDRAYEIGLCLDRRFELAMKGFARRGGHVELRTILDALAGAADETVARIDAAPPAQGDPAWRATCQIIRDGERDVLRHVARAVRTADDLGELAASLDRARAG
ncbi:MAG: SET domain-containing protein [Deltaproteobacteria bacterium]|nr:SET domain-containing protein [Kofleriaceae bacterium]